MATRKKTATTPWADLYRARRLAHELEIWAFRIQDGRTSETERAELVTRVRRLDAAWMGLDGRRALDRDVAARELIRDTCREATANGLTLQRAEMLALARLSDALPELGPALFAHRDQVRAVLRARQQNRGGRGKRAEQTADDALEVLLRTLGLGATIKTLKRSATRRRKLPPA